MYHARPNPFLNPLCSKYMSTITKARILLGIRKKNISNDPDFGYKFKFLFMSESSLPFIKAKHNPL